MSAADPTIPELEQLESIEFESIDNDIAVRLGEVAVATIRDLNLNLAVDIVIDDDLVFRAKLGSTGPGNDPWLAKKAATARHFGTTSLLARLRSEAGDGTLPPTSTEQAESMALYGGSFPIRVRGDLRGTITMSGETDTVDHTAVVETIRRFLSP